MVTFFGNVPQVHQVKFPGGARTQLTFFDDNPARGVSYQPATGDYFIFSKDVGGDQNYQIYRYDFSTSDITLLTDGQSKNSPGVWSNAGDRIVYGKDGRGIYVTTDRNSDFQRLAYLDLKTRQYTFLTDSIK